MQSSAWRDMLLDPAGRKHLVLIHQTDPYLHACVAAWASRSLTTGSGAILVGRASYLSAIVRQIRLLGVDTDDRIASGRLVLLDGNETLARLLEDGRPDPKRFADVVDGAVAKVRAACGGNERDVRAWGEMVSLLHEKGRGPEARELEVLWDQFLGHERVQLLCSYKLGGLADISDACDTHATLLVESPLDMEATSARVLKQMFGVQPAGSALSHLMQRGAVPIGGTPPTALLLPLDQWQRPM